MIHPTAIIEEGAQLGNDVSVAPFAYIGGSVKIGDGCSIGQGVRIEGRTTLGKNNKVGAYTVLGTPPQSTRHRDNDIVELVIGDDNDIKEYVLISTGTDYDSKVTRVGNGNYIMAYCHLGHDGVIGDGCILANSTQLGGHVRIGNKVVFGATAAVHQFVRIGDYCMIGGAAAVTQDIPPFCLAEGNRAKLRGLNTVGIRRNLGRDAVNALKPAFKALFRSGRTPKSVAAELIETTDNETVRDLCRFTLEAKRGVPISRTNHHEEEEA